MIDQLRTGLYPQLGQTSMVSEPMSDLALPAPPPVMQEAMRKGTEAIAGAGIVPEQEAARPALAATLARAARKPLSAGIDDSANVEYKVFRVCRHSIRTSCCRLVPGRPIGSGAMCRSAGTVRYSEVSVGLTEFEY